MKTNKWAVRSWVAVVSILATSGVSAGPVVWTDWTSLTNGTTNPASSATGTMGSIGVTVRATNVMNGVSQLQGPGGNCVNTNQSTANTNFWVEPNPNDRPYTGGTVSNGPTPCEQIGLNSANSLTVTFSSAVDVLYMALLSVGQGGLAVTYDFSSAFSIDSEGQGFWGNDSTDGVLGANDTLTMREFHGVLRFAAPVTSFTVTTGAENWQAFTFGMAVPEPGSLALVGVALLGAGAASRRRKAA